MKRPRLTHPRAAGLAQPEHDMRDDMIKRYDSLLAPYAVHNAGEHEREYDETESENKLPFQRDRDRIIHSKAFRRLKHKTQVWVTGKNDHIRDRLTHSLEGAQIARGMARDLRLNEDLAEAGILAHDLGHPPFGHEGEHALHQMLEPLGFHFDHNLHSLRIVTRLENNYPDFPGLNLTRETLACLRKHETPWEMEHAPVPHEASLEAQIVNLADEIAYYAHDIDDGLRSGLIHYDALGQLEIGKLVDALLASRYPHLTREHRAYQAQYVRSVVHILITDITSATAKRLRDLDISSLQDVYKHDQPIAAYSDMAEQATDELRKHLYANFYLHPDVKKRTQEGVQLIQELFTRFHDHPEWLPEQRRALIDVKEPKAVVIKDYIAGMTDTFLQKTVLELRQRLI